MNAIQKWFTDHNFSSHTIATALTAAFGLYIGNSQVKSVVDGILSQHPKWSAAFGLALSLYLKYSGTYTAPAAATLAAKQGVTATIEQPRAIAEPTIVVSKQPAPTPPITTTVEPGGK